MSIDLSKVLNPEQAKAANIIEGPVLIIAGAGSGKTRMITYRIANMLEQGINEKEILALTFTNKAASEMRERIVELTGNRLKKLTCTTFHSFGLGLLKQYIQQLGYKNNFTIYDTNDNLSLIKEIIVNKGYSLADYNAYAILSLFSDLKTGRKIKNFTKKNIELDEFYEEWLLSQKTYNVVDFDDLITLPIKLFTERPDILSAVQERYKYIMVDEFQDTSLLQYNFIRNIAKKYQNICVVGDDDQSIYSWRGANYQNLLLFEKDFPNLSEIKLERNYRSTGTILDAANSVITHNKQRKSKKLWTKSDKGATINIFHSKDDDAEAEKIVMQIRDKAKNSLLSYSDFGILLRTNSLIPTFENYLQYYSIPYQISGGSSFFDRKEIRDLISYLKFLINIDDDNTLLRIINIPRRGIGRATIDKLRYHADKNKTTIFDAMTHFAYNDDTSVKENTKNSFKQFISLINKWENYLKSNENSKLLELIISDINYQKMLYEEYPDNDNIVKFKMNGLDFLVKMLSRFEKSYPEGKLSEFINRITLDNSEEVDDAEGKVNLLTMHASKGLEFDIVYLPALEDNIIPSSKALMENEDAIYEERRLFYVAITRARKELTLSTALSRKDYMGQKKETLPSRFLKEIPEALLCEAKLSSIEMLEALQKKLKLN